MIYKNDSSAAVSACERQRTGNYGADEYNNCAISAPVSLLPDDFRIWKETDIVNDTNFYYDSKLYKIDNCEIIKDLTPDREPAEKIYLCKCKVCGNTFTRCRKTLVFSHSDCGCVYKTGFRTGMHTDHVILNLDSLTKKVILAKINAIGNPNITDTFKALYIDKKPYSEYTALDMGMSMATLYRSRKQIHKLLPVLKNNITNNIPGI